MNLTAALKKLLDPVGPIGEVVSPADVYKTRLGLPVQSPHVARAKMEAPADVERALAAPRFASMEEQAPKDRVRQVSAFVDEHWAPAYERTDSTDILTILLTSQRQVGWTVTQRESQQSRTARRARQNAEQFAEVCQTAQIQDREDFYVQYMETIPGDDPVIIDGEILRGEAVFDEHGKMVHDGIVRGGTMVRSRKHYNSLTKNMVTWDKGTWEKHVQAEAEYCARPVQNVRRAMEAIGGERLPMWRPTGINFRRDRRSAV